MQEKTDPHRDAGIDAITWFVELIHAKLKRKPKRAAIAIAELVRLNVFVDLGSPLFGIDRRMKNVK